MTRWTILSISWKFSENGKTVVVLHYFNPTPPPPENSRGQETFGHVFGHLIFSRAQMSITPYCECGQKLILDVRLSRDVRGITGFLSTATGHCWNSFFDLFFDQPFASIINYAQESGSCQSCGRVQNNGPALVNNCEWDTTHGLIGTRQDWGAGPGGASDSVRVCYLDLFVALNTSPNADTSNQTAGHAKQRQGRN